MTTNMSAMLTDAVATTKVAEAVADGPEAAATGLMAVTVVHGNSKRLVRPAFFF